jgi:hypothetical protein
MRPGFQHRVEILGLPISQIFERMTLMLGTFATLRWNSSSMAFTVIDAVRDLCLKMDSKRGGGDIGKSLRQSIGKSESWNGAAQ